MMEDIELKTFPSSNLEALALLYVQNQDLKGKLRLRFIRCIRMHCMKSSWIGEKSGTMVIFRDHR